MMRSLQLGFCCLLVLFGCSQLSADETSRAEPVTSEDERQESTTSNELASAEVTPPQVSGHGEIPLRILYLTRNDADRTDAFRELFEQHFESVAVTERDKFIPAQADNFDVVVLDWSQSERPTGRYDSPLGRLEDWSTPVVFLGSAGLMMAGPWDIIGGAG